MPPRDVAGILDQAERVYLDAGKQVLGPGTPPETTSTSDSKVSPHPGSPFHFSGYLPPRKVQARALGADNERILKGLGYREDEIDHNRADGVIGESPRWSTESMQPSSSTNLDPLVQSGRAQYIDAGYIDILSELASDLQ
jgi:hypothetical protein